jgi:hypothetical protein
MKIFVGLILLVALIGFLYLVTVIQAEDGVHNVIKIEMTPPAEQMTHIRSYGGARVIRFDDYGHAYSINRGVTVWHEH